MNFIIRNIPNSITCLNIIAGTMAIICASYGDSSLWGMPAWGWACIFIGIAAVADFFDGFASRLLHGYSELGKQLDSLCDLVSFGVAPAILLFNCLDISAQAHWLKWVVLLIPVCGAIRLARFNIDNTQTDSFIGLPIPANAIFWIGFVANVYTNPGFLPAWPLTLAIILLEAWWMVSPFRMFSFKMKHWGWKGNEWRWSIVIATLIFVGCLKTGGLMWAIVYYWGASTFAMARNK